MYTKNQGNQKATARLRGKTFKLIPCKKPRRIPIRNTLKDNRKIKQIRKNYGEAA